MAALDSCLRGISASLHKLTLVSRVRHVLATAIIAVALVEGACARITCQNRFGISFYSPASGLLRC